MATYNPFGDIEVLRREIDRTFEDFWGGRQPRSWRVAFLPGQASRRYPLVNLYEDKDNFFVEALAPGIDPDSLELTVDNGVLTISGEKKEPQDVAEEAYHRSERAAGKFARRVELSGTVDVDTVKADYKNGVLMITLPKAPEAKPRQISVSTR
ncbi:MAG: Hsp20/alpha crystallin family protein [Chloroflexi bacterium]|nr:Hsp20/alpha crystallin family protein [Chloroflexota bacterium]